MYYTENIYKYESTVQLYDTGELPLYLSQIIFNLDIS